MEHHSNFFEAIKSEFPNGKIKFTLIIKYFLLNPKFCLMLNYHVGKRFSKSRFFVNRQIGRYLKTRMILKRGCDISYNAQIGNNLKLPHPLGIVIGEGVVVRDNVKIFQNVTLGSHGRSGVGQKYPIVEPGVRIYAGAIIIGGVTIGENAIIGANAVVNIDVPPNTIAVGIPCRILKPN
jgi:serine O-acetyltransferase